MFRIFTPNLLTPHLRIDSVVELTPDRLAEIGITSLLLDVDATLKPYRSREPLDKVAEWLRHVRESGIGLCLVSNGRSQRIGPFAAALALPYVAPAMKPLPYGVRRAVRMMNFIPEHTAMVGDQIFADILAGRLAGLTTILVSPIFPEQEPWFARMKRPFERLLGGKSYRSSG
ncbi:MAG TPA: YqeG family HAD IIIA-type phosphatase [Planctomycetaceae bacterium]|nr:YqeG family HAD IIIA-type phosphatase [Planctomycetaceae bacterium]